MAGISINTNVAAEGAKRRLDATTRRLQGIQGRLASGLRISHASDDASGLAVASLLEMDSRIYSQAVRNINDGISAVQIAEGALSQLSAVTIPQAELCEQAANGTLSHAQRNAINREANALAAEFNRIVQSTNFNGQALFDPLESDLVVQAGLNQTSNIGLTLDNALERKVGLGSVSSVSVVSDRGLGAAFADLNGDGNLDLVGAGNSVYASFGNGDGSFSSISTVGDIRRPVGDVVFGDFNGDGTLDIAAGNYSNTNVFVILGLGGGTFASAMTFDVGALPSRLSAADLNGDGRSDLLVGSGAVLLANADGSLRSSAVLAGSMQTVEAADVNADGNLDAIWGGTGSVIGVALGNGDGTFANSMTLTVGDGGAAARDIAINDFNLDGRADFATSCYASGATSVFVNNGDGTFAMSASIGTSALALAVTSGDLNNDGIPDLVTAHFGGPGVGAAFGNGDGTFRTPALVLGGNWRFLTLADVNDDGVLDLGYGTTSSGRVALQNTTSSALAPQLNLNTVSGAYSAMQTVAAQLQRVTSQLGAIGSVQSRLTTALESVRTLDLNYRQAASQITDADMAEESSALVRTNVLQQAAQAVLAQANQSPALALKLLSSL